MTRVTDQDAFATLLAEATDFEVHFGDQRTGRVEHPQAALIRFAAHRLRHAVGAENNGCIIGHFAQLVHEHGAAFAQMIDHVPIVHHFVTHIDRRAEQIQRPLHDFDGAIHTGAETTRVGQNNVHHLPSDFCDQRFRLEADHTTLLPGNIRLGWRVSHRDDQTLENDLAPGERVVEIDLDSLIMNFQHRAGELLTVRT